MTLVKMKATDTMHISNVQADNLLAGDVFEIAESEARALEDRGLAKRVTEPKSDAPAPKKAARAKK